MRLFRAKTNFVVGEVGSMSQTKIFEGQLFALYDKNDLPLSRSASSTDIKLFYEEIVPKSILYKTVDSLIKTKELKN